VPPDYFDHAIQVAFTTVFLSDARIRFQHGLNIAKFLQGLPFSAILISLFLARKVRQAASELMTRRLPEEKASALAEQLTSGKWTHDYPIWASTAKSLGLPVSTDMPNGVLELMTLYPQPVRMQSGGVEYLPVERRSPREGSRLG